MPDDITLPWDTIEEIADNENNCFTIYADGIEKIKTFSPETNRAISLYPTGEAPTMLIAGLPMHRIKNTTPNKDTIAKVKSIQPLSGRVLDTATGLGYTSIQASRSAREVVTIELDPSVLEIARQNPWSQALFEAANIQQQVGDSWDVIEEMQDGSFDAILHDPPMMGLAGHLYSQEFYEELRRVLKTSGRLFHYIGDPTSKMGGNITKGVLARLEKAGFSGIKRYPQGFGVIAKKGKE